MRLGIGLALLAPLWADRGAPAPFALPLMGGMDLDARGSGEEPTTPALSHALPAGATRMGLDFMDRVALPAIQCQSLDIGGAVDCGCVLFGKATQVDSRVFRSLSLFQPSSDGNGAGPLPMGLHSSRPASSRPAATRGHLEPHRDLDGLLAFTPRLGGTELQGRAATRPRVARRERRSSVPMPTRGAPASPDAERRCWGT
jgi:hypothetical protein